MPASARPTLDSPASSDLLAPSTQAERRRHLVRNLAKAEGKASLGQFMTPEPIAKFMASLFLIRHGQEIRLLDPGAGVGSLSAALVEAICNRASSPSQITIAAFEIDTSLIDHLDATLTECAETAALAGHHLHYEIHTEDFIVHAVNLAAPQLSSQARVFQYFTHAILNPPYKKINTGSEHRQLLRRLGIESTNLYSAFVALSLKLLAPQGQLVAITPRSFCNGPYFRRFRHLLVSEASFTHIHTFRSRDQAFRDDTVLQENVVFHLVKGALPSDVTVSASHGLDLADPTTRSTPYEQIIKPSDANSVIHIPTSDYEESVARRLSSLPCSLHDVGIQVSTGPVVDFRLRPYLHSSPMPSTAPLLYAAHFSRGNVTWPGLNGRKPNSIDVSPQTVPWLMPTGHYTVTRRFTSKEERRRIVASLFDPTCTQAQLIGFENHLNVFHTGGKGLPPKLARGLCIFLNYTGLDTFFRLFNGHTQVNASDLRSIHYPTRGQLEELGEAWPEGPLPGQDHLDNLVERALFRDSPPLTG